MTITSRLKQNIFLFCLITLYNRLKLCQWGIFAGVALAIDSDWRLWYKNTVIYEITEVKTVAGQQLLKDKIAVTLPIKMTPDEVKKLSADTSKGEYNDAENMWYFYDATYEITNNAKFTMPKAA